MHHEELACTGLTDEDLYQARGAPKWSGRGDRTHRRDAKTHLAPVRFASCWTAARHL